MYLRKIEITNYRGISRAAINLNENTVMIGENSSGKSAILEAVCKILTSRENDGQITFDPHEFYQVHREGQYHPAGDLSIALTFSERSPDEWSYLQSNEMGLRFPDIRNVIQDLTVEVTASPDPANRESRAGWRILIPGMDTSGLNNDPSVIEWIRRMNPVFRVRGGILTSPGITPVKKVNAETEISSGEDIAARIRSHVEKLLSGTSPDLHRELRMGFRSAMNYIDQASALFKPENLRDQDLIAEILGRQAPGGAETRKAVPLRHGSAAEMIGMLLFTAAMLQSGTQLPDPGSEPIFIFEDPEANLHPMTLEAVRLMINRIKWQKIITTQSGSFLSGFPMMDILRISRQDGVVSQWRILPDSLQREELRRLSYHIRMRRGTANFARCWLLVEGESEIWLLPHLAKLCGYELNMEGVICVEFAQCGIAPLIKAARQLGIEWHLLADGDAAGKSYIETAKHFARQTGEDFSLRLTRLRERDIEHHLFFNGYSSVYLEYAGFSDNAANEWQARKIISRAIHRHSKPFMAIAIVEAISREGSPGVPPVLEKVIATSVRLAKGNI